MNAIVSSTNAITDVNCLICSCFPLSVHVFVVFNAFVGFDVA